VGRRRVLLRLRSRNTHDHSSVDFLKNEKGQRKVWRDDPETALFMDLRDVYVSLCADPLDVP
jgi:hypothetical protein